MDGITVLPAAEIAERVAKTLDDLWGDIEPGWRQLPIHDQDQVDASLSEGMVELGVTDRQAFAEGIGMAFSVLTRFGTMCDPRAVASLVIYIDRLIATAKDVQ